LDDSRTNTWRAQPADASGTGSLSLPEENSQVFHDTGEFKGTSHATAVRAARWLFGMQWSQPWLKNMTDFHQSPIAVLCPAEIPFAAANSALSGIT